MQYTTGAQLKELFARSHTESPRSMSYGLFSKTVYANFSETRNISGILQGEEVFFSPLSLCSLGAAVIFCPLLSIA